MSTTKQLAAYGKALEDAKQEIAISYVKSPIPDLQQSGRYLGLEEAQKLFEQIVLLGKDNED